MIVGKTPNLLGNDAVVQFVVSDGDEPDGDGLWLGKVEDPDSFPARENGGAELHDIVFPFEVLDLALTY